MSVLFTVSRSLKQANAVITSLLEAGRLSSLGLVVVDEVGSLY